MRKEREMSIRIGLAMLVISIIVGGKIFLNPDFPNWALCVVGVFIGLGSFLVESGIRE